MSLKSLIPRRRREIAARRDPLLAFRREMDEVFDRFFGSGDLSLWPPDSFAPSIDVSETDDEIRVTAELPGVDEKDIDISVSNEALVIKGEKKQEKEEKDGGRHYVERSYGAFERDIQLPCEVDADKAAARYSRGVLTITLPKTAKGRSSKRIPISEK